MENKYFTPDIEEMFVGCEFEMDDTWGGWKKLILTEDLLKNPLIGLGSGNERAPWYWKIRVPYLTKEQIEAEGWKFIKHHAEIEGYEFEKDEYSLYVEFDFRGEVYLKIYSGGYYDEVNYFSGKCKDINTFRKICKLLEI